jgi:hypothetical protein
MKKVQPAERWSTSPRSRVELARRERCSTRSRPGEHVLDLFGGSGSTLIGAEQTGRKAFLMELDPLYCDVIVDRYRGETRGASRARWRDGLARRRARRINRASRARMRLGENT